MHDTLSKTVPKRVIDIIDVVNHNQSSGKNIRRSLELDTLSTTSQSKFKTDSPSATQIFSNIDVNGVIIRGKTRHWWEINAMPLNIYVQLNQKLNGKLELRPCDKIKVIGIANNQWKSGQS